jgi:hypothetical protein
MILIIRYAWSWTDQDNLPGNRADNGFLMMPVRRILRDCENFRFDQQLTGVTNPEQGGNLIPCPTETRP